MKRKEKKKKKKSRAKKLTQKQNMTKIFPDAF